ncbi:NADH-quinone oxidoreductase subunit F [Flavipsychrobacter stenotrophus]|uniref:NADH-quinone oxidoreductase subunit F n=1 Tax=Flavipsychrobacter stenotrophus TaxID=2077091 RepID=A0A2S7SRS0_9BACT|nr:NAD(P)H-binding protein [Flavipsychrobacter stenotrophus]PQJ09418.1 NADH-quinone oxidoreductase subunit F [Flavipsychrobacter stenotrophus]
MRTAIVIGATGLVGNELTRLLLKDSRIGQVKIFVRRKTGLSHSKLEEHIVDFNLPDEWKKLVTGDVLYSALGTTLKAAGSKEAQYTVDHTYQFNTAKAAAANGVQKYVLVSAGGASANSKIFYSRMKGELERDIRKLPFETIHIIRPGMLKGHRANTRTGEIIGGAVLGLVSRLPGLKALQPIEGHEVAKAMINASFRHIVGIHSYSPGELFKLAELVSA